MQVLKASVGNARTLSRAARPQRGSVVAAAAKGKHIVITGANTGIGFESARELAQKDFRITLACRDDAKAAAAVQRIKEAVPGADVSALHLDLSDLDSVRDAANKLLDFDAAIDVLLNNAGVMACPYMTTKQGFEYQLGTNHLGHFLFTTLLLPKLQQSPGPVRIVNVASAAHQFGKIDFDSFRNPKNYQEWPFYGQSKLANIMFTYELARRLKGTSNITTNCLHPGVVRTELGRYMLTDQSSFVTKAMWALMTPFTKSPIQGAQTNIHLASSPEVEGISGKYYADEKPISSSPASYDVDVAKKLYDVSLELVGQAVGSAAVA